MSRIGRLPVKLPSGVSVAVKSDSVDIKGPKGTASVAIPKDVQVRQEGDELLVAREGNGRQVRALHGLTRKSIYNTVTGLSAGFTRVLEINGVGYRADLRGNSILFSLGYSHPILFQLPPGITAKIDKQVTITLEGPDRQVIGATAAAIRELRPPEPYKGKGIKYAEEKIRRKSGKAAGAA
ncbi:50S ribosomal protein L6 [Candidatus Binatia bacterium]|jgi:large subunit ribosomal protein L6|nr:50S ribosomal protein L6 [Candidatus Binatia bacterium]